ncbi:MAG: TetR/AcrR family transcriptional regulator [Clostridia bacterium]|nr:TetR/AcrR family transcriptional regulator [Clostridia bacterium]
MRVVKDAEVRRNEILDAAEELFGSKGFDGTSTNDILDRVGIARGTLYYHFRSKEEILDAMIARMADRLIADAAKVAEDRSIPLLERLPRTVLALNVDSSIGEEVMQQVHRPQNALLHQKLQDRLLRGVIPLITLLVEDGIGQGIFRTDYPREAAEMIMIYSYTAFDGLAMQTAEQRQRRVDGFIYNTERILGAQEGALREAILKIF